MCGRKQHEIWEFEFTWDPVRHYPPSTSYLRRSAFSFTVDSLVLWDFEYFLYESGLLFYMVVIYVAIQVAAS